ncbi:hypothetical protein Plhal304r1_c008g0033431 [Plasmopara halstedii]
MQYFSPISPASQRDFAYLFRAHWNGGTAQEIVARSCHDFNAHDEEDDFSNVKQIKEQ